MAEFKQMPKMMTNEPTVILKLKKGGHVASEHKDDAGHTNMKGKAFMSARAEEAAEEGASPKKPSMSERRKAMSGALLNSKKGGKVSGAAIDKFEVRSAIEGGANKFAKTKVHDGDKTDKASGTGEIKEGKPAGYKTGGTIEGNVSKFAKTKVDDGARKDTASGTGEVKEGKPAGYKKGGAIDWENRPANDGDSFDSAHGTKGVKEANAGGYKKGGAAKKHFATGGSVNNAGKAVAMPKHFVSKPVSNTAQSGTFKKGGTVGKFAGGGLEDASQGAYDRASQPEGMGIANAIRNAPGAAYSAAKRLLGIKPEAGAGRGNVNPPLARKSGGSTKR